MRAEKNPLIHPSPIPLARDPKSGLPVWTCSSLTGKETKEGLTGLPGPESTPTEEQAHQNKCQIKS